MNFNIFYAYSREKMINDNYDDKLYVQVLILRNEALVCDMLFNNSAKIVIIGNSKTLPGSIEKTLKRIIKIRHPTFDEKDIEDKIINLRNNNQIYVESW